jgi:predicted membrane protein DUF2142
LRVFLLSCLAFTLLGAGWATASPYGQGYDEDAHLLRAAGVAYGQWYVEPRPAVLGAGGWVRVPSGLLPPHRQCLRVPKAVHPPASCLGDAPGGGRLVPVASAAARYDPLYYALVGWPLRLLPDGAGVLGARLVSAFASALLLAAALALAWRYRRSRLLPAAVLLVATPTELDLAGTVNPNGLEISAAIAFWTALIVLTRTARLAPPRTAAPTATTGPSSGQAPAGGVGRAGRGRRRSGVPLGPVLVVAAAGGGVLLVLRPMGPLFVLVAVGACVVVARPGRAAELARRPAVRGVAAGLSLVAAGAVAWTVSSGLLHSGDGQYQAGVVANGASRGEPVTAGWVLANVVPAHAGDWTRQVVGRFYGGYTPPDWVLAVWFGLLLVLLVAGMLRGGPRVAATVGGTLLLAAALAVVLEVRYYPALGDSQQGRYYLPVLAGAVLLAGSAPVLRPGAAGRLTLLVAAVAGPVHLVCLAGMMTIWQQGASPGFPLDPLGGAWQPGGGPLLPLAVTAAGGLLLATIAVHWYLHTQRRPGTLARRPGPGPLIARLDQPLPAPLAAAGRPGLARLVTRPDRRRLARLVARPGRVGRPAVVRWPVGAPGGWRPRAGRVGVRWHIVGGDGDDPA